MNYNLKLIDNTWEKERLMKRGVALGDEVRINPLTGKKKSLKLLRTRIDFISEEIFDSYSSLSKVCLPALKNERFIYSLELIEDGKGQSRARYIFKSLTNRPFSINGMLCLSCFVEKGDRVLIGHNELHFLENEIYRTQIEELSMEIVKSNYPILLSGETGTGKSTLAKKMHKVSEHFGKFVHLNLSSFSPGLIESEIFGHEKGAFTGACTKKQGAIKEAENGTLFLDEINSLSIDLQVKLLLFLDNKTYRSVGSEREQKVNCRLMFATNQEISGEVKSGRMRTDFAQRILSSAKVVLNPLREDLNKIKIFCLKFADENNVTIDKNLIDYYQKFSWPGNYRQLKSHLELKLIMSKMKKLNFCALDETLDHRTLGINKAFSSVYFESEIQSFVERAYQKTGGSITHTAKLLNTSCSKVRRYLNLKIG